MLDERPGVVDQEHPAGVALRHPQIPDEDPLDVGEALDIHDFGVPGTEIDFDDRRRGPGQGRVSHDQPSSSAW